MKKKWIIAGCSFFLLLVLIAIIVYSHKPVNRFMLKPMKYDFYIQAGHEGRTSGRTGAQTAFGREIDWTPLVADEATRILEEAGFSVKRDDATLERRYLVELAIAIHFDACEKSCGTGAAIGYDDPTDKPAADEWKKIYGTYYPFPMKSDNHTRNLRHYYAFWWTITRDAELVIELGDMNCQEEAEWLRSNLKKLGHIIAYFCARRVGSDAVSKP